jgi:hypothetical protein
MTSFHSFCFNLRRRSLAEAAIVAAGAAARPGPGLHRALAVAAAVRGRAAGAPIAGVRGHCDLQSNKQIKEEFRADVQRVCLVHKDPNEPDTGCKSRF